MTAFSPVLTTAGIPAMMSGHTTRRWDCGPQRRQKLQRLNLKAMSRQIEGTIATYLSYMTLARDKLSSTLSCLQRIHTFLLILHPLDLDSTQHPIWPPCGRNAEFLHCLDCSPAPGQIARPHILLSSVVGQPKPMYSSTPPRSPSPTTRPQSSKSRIAGTPLIERRSGRSSPTQAKRSPRLEPPQVRAVNRFFGIFTLVELDK